MTYAEYDLLRLIMRFEIAGADWCGLRSEDRNTAKSLCRKGFLDSQMAQGVIVYRTTDKGRKTLEADQ